MAEPVVMTTTLVTKDGVPIDAVHLPGARDLAIVVAHGFTFSWQRPDVWRITSRFNRRAGVVTFDFRGHGRSGGLSTLGDREIEDVDVAVRYARSLGYQHVVTVGFSMGGSVVLRHAGLMRGVDAVVSVSGPGRWFYRGTVRMRRLHWAVERRVGRMVTRHLLKTRVSPFRWGPEPLPPAEAAALVSPVPLLIVHGDRDLYFPVDHAEGLFEAANDPKDLWIVPGFAHAESGCDDKLVDRMIAWISAAVGVVAGAADIDGASAPGDTSPAT